MKFITVATLLLFVIWKADAACDEGWVETSFNKCYKFVTQPQTWYGAQQVCVMSGGNLAMYKTREEINAMKTMRRGKPELGSVLWIGARRVNKNWFWVEYQKRPLPLTESDWACNQPENNPNQGCVFMAEERAAFLWHDAPCMEKRAFICEKANLNE